MRLEDAMLLASVDVLLTAWEKPYSHGIGSHLAEVILGQSFIGLGASSYWRCVLGDDYARIGDHSFAVGFIEGALEVWRKSPGYSEEQFKAW